MINQTLLCVIFALLFCVFVQLKAQNNSDLIIIEDISAEICKNEDASRLSADEHFKKLNTQLPSWFFTSPKTTYCGVSFPLADSIIAEQQAILMARMIAALSQKEYNKIECSELFQIGISDSIATGDIISMGTMTLLLPFILSVKYSEIIANESVVVGVECDFTKTDTLRVAWKESIRDGSYSCRLLLNGRNEEMYLNEDNKNLFLRMSVLEPRDENHPYGRMVETNLHLPIEDEWTNRNIYANNNAAYHILQNIFQTTIAYYRWTKNQFSMSGSWNYIPVDNKHFKIINIKI